MTGLRRHELSFKRLGRPWVCIINQHDTLITSTAVSCASTASPADILDLRLWRRLRVVDIIRNIRSDLRLLFANTAIETAQNFTPPSSLTDVRYNTCQGP